MDFDVLIIGGGVAGMQCALVLGSAKEKTFASNKKIGIILHQKTSHLQNAMFNNVLGLRPKTLGEDILKNGKEQLSNLYSHVSQIENEKVLTIEDLDGSFKIITTKKEYLTKIAVIALNYSKPFSIAGLEEYLQPHAKANPLKNRVQLINENHFIKNGLYACGTIAAGVLAAVDGSIADSCSNDDGVA